MESPSSKVLTTMKMKTRPKGKFLMGAWLPSSVVTAIAKWLEAHPGMDQTSFLITALDEKLLSAGIRVSRKAVQSRRLRDFPTHGGGVGELKESRQPDKPRKLGRLKTSPKHRANKLLVKARVDEALAAGIESWLNLNPQLDRTDFISAAVTEKLTKDGTELLGLPVARKELRRPLRPQAFAGIKRESADVQVAEFAYKVRESLKQLEEFTKHRRAEAPEDFKKLQGPLLQHLKSIERHLKQIMRSATGLDLCATEAVAKQLPAPNRQVAVTALEIRPGTDRTKTPHLISVALDLRERLKRKGAACIAFSQSSKPFLLIGGLPQADIEEIIEEDSKAFASGGWYVQFLQTDNLRFGRQKLSTLEMTPGAIIRKKLTKKVLFQLPEGAYIVSNCFTKQGDSIFKAHLNEREEPRGKVWKRAHDSGAEGRLFDVFWDEEEYEKAASVRTRLDSTLPQPGPPEPC